MGDLSFTAATLELAATIEDLRQSLPKAPVTELRRDQFEAQSASQRMQFIRNGGKVVGEAPPRPKAVLRDGQIRRSDFDKLGPAERHQLIRGGSAVVD